MSGEYCTVVCRVNVSNPDAVFDGRSNVSSSVYIAQRIKLDIRYSIIGKFQYFLKICKKVSSYFTIHSSSNLFVRLLRSKVSFLIILMN